MTQGQVKTKGPHKNVHSAKHKKAVSKQKSITKGNPRQLPKNKFLNEALDDRDLTKAINKASEKKVAAKVLQSGGVLALSDVKQSGKALNRELRRKMVKRKLTRVEEKLKILEAKAEEGNT